MKRVEKLERQIEIVLANHKARAAKITDPELLIHEIKFALSTLLDDEKSGGRKTDAEVNDGK